MPQLLLSLVSEFAGRFVDLLISSFEWNKEERAKVQCLKKQLLETLDDTIHYLLHSPTVSMHREILRQWNHLVVDLEAYECLTQRIEGFASAIIQAPSWNTNQKLGLAIRLSAFKASVLRTNSANLKKLSKKCRPKKQARRVDNNKLKNSPQRRSNKKNTAGTPEQRKRLAMGKSLPNSAKARKLTQEAQKDVYT